MPDSVVDTNVPLMHIDGLTPAALAFTRDHAAGLEPVGADPAQLLEHMDQAGIQTAWVTSHCARDVLGPGWDANKWVASYVQADPARLVAVGGYDPRYDGDAEAAVRSLVKMGIRAVKVHPPHQHLRPNGPRLRPLLASCSRNGLPVILHVGGSAFPGAAAKFGSLDLAGRACASFPDAKVLLSNDGHLPPSTPALLEFAKAHPNAFLQVVDPAQLAELASHEGLVRRLLWGSAWPAPGSTAMAPALRRVRAVGLDARAERAILCENPAQVIQPAIPTRA